MKLQLHVIGKLLNYKLYPITLKIVINYNNYKLQIAITPSLIRNDCRWVGSKNHGSDRSLFNLSYCT